jgi:toxin ParE1/3/4
MYHVSITLFAAKYIDATFLYYDNIRPNLGDQLIKEIDKAIFYLERYPAIGSVRYQDVRCFVLRKFPYMIHYLIDEKNQAVIVIGFYGTKTDPQKWRAR